MKVFLLPMALCSYNLLMYNSLIHINHKCQCNIIPTIYKCVIFFSSLMFQAEDLILKGFPKKIVELNELLETSQFGRQDLSEVHQPLNIPVPDPVLINRYALSYNHLKFDKGN